MKTFPMKSLQVLVPLFLCGASAVQADTIVFDSLSTGAKGYGHGTYGISNLNNGTVPQGTNPGTYNGGSPAFQFVPSGITNGDSLSEFKVGIGDDYFTGVYDFHVTLFTSGASQQLDPSLWTQLGSWGGQTDGQYNSGAGTPTPSLVSVPASGVTLVNGDYYYLMATADPNQGLDYYGNNYLDWGVSSAFYGPAWEPLDNNYNQDAPIEYSGGGVMQVLVGPEDVSVPEPSTLFAMSGLVLSSAIELLTRRRRTRFRTHPTK